MSDLSNKALIKPIGFIGLGIMGHPMCSNLLDAGFPMIVYNRTISKTKDLVAKGASLASSPKEVGSKSSTIITMVSDSPDVEEVILGTNGIIHGMEPQTTVIDMSTISPNVTRRISQKLSEKGGHLLDAPVSGSSWAAQDGTLSIMVGGEKQIFLNSLPILEAMGNTIIYIGPTGMGQVCKLVNQVIVSGTLAAVCEGLLLGAKAGVDLHKVHQAVTGGAANSWQLENLGSRILKRDFNPGFSVDLMLKDQRLVDETCQSLELPLPMFSLVRQFFYMLSNNGLGGEGTQSYIKTLEGLTGIIVEAPE